MPFQPLDTRYRKPRPSSPLDGREERGSYESSLDLNDYVVRHPASTFFMEAQGRGMENAGIFSGDLLVIDRAAEPSSGRIIVAVIHGEFVIRLLKVSDRRAFLISEDPTIEPVEIAPDADVMIWGIIIAVIHKI